MRSGSGISARGKTKHKTREKERGRDYLTIVAAYRRLYQISRPQKQLNFGKNKTSCPQKSDESDFQGPVRLHLFEVDGLSFSFCLSCSLVQGVMILDLSITWFCQMVTVISEGPPTAKPGNPTRASKQFYCVIDESQVSTVHCLPYPLQVGSAGGCHGCAYRKVTMLAA